MTSQVPEWGQTLRTEAGYTTRLLPTHFPVTRPSACEGSLFIAGPGDAGLHGGCTGVHVSTHFRGRMGRTGLIQKACDGDNMALACVHERLALCIHGPHFSFFPFIFISWRLITLQYCSGFCHTLTWISHGFTCIPHPDPFSHLPLHPIPLGLPSTTELNGQILSLLLPPQPVGFPCRDRMRWLLTEWGTCTQYNTSCLLCHKLDPQIFK